MIIFSQFEMFSAEHFITLGVILAIILILFFTRKFFIKYKVLDIIFRVVLAFIIVGSEIKLRSHPGTADFAHNMPIPLCGHLLWIAGLALLADSERIYRRVYPLCLTGACLSMIVVAGIPHFPEFRAWQYFFVHGGFLIGALYFVFTRKINRFEWKDFGWSCLLLLVMGGIMSIFTILGVRDDYMLIKPDPALQDIYNALGQVGYTFVYILVIVGLMALWTLITWLCTRHRTDEMANVPTFKENRFMTYMSSHYTKQMRWIAVVVSSFAFMILLSLQHFTMNVAFAYVLAVYLFLVFALIIFNEILHNYELRPTRE